MPVSFGMLEGQDYRLLAGPSGEGPLIGEVYGGLSAPNKRVLSRHLSRGKYLTLYRAELLAR